MEMAQWVKWVIDEGRGDEISLLLGKEKGKGKEPWNRVDEDPGFFD